MQIVERALKELKKVVLILILGDKIINSLLVFSGFLLIFNIFGILWYYSFVPFFGYLLAVAVYTYLSNLYLDVERKVPDMKEQLRTVADNVYKSNEILDSLKQDVLKQMRKVKTSYFMDIKFLTLRLLILCTVAFIIVILAFLNVKFEFKGFDLSNDINEIGIRNSKAEVPIVEYRLSEGNINSILGNKSLAELGKKEFQLKVNPLDSEADLSVLSGEDSNKDFIDSSFPKEIYTRYDVAYNEKIARENRDIVRNYFEEIIGETNG